MNTLKKDVLKAIETASLKAKAKCCTKGIEYSGLYFSMILSQLEQFKDNYKLPQKTILHKIKLYFFRRQVRNNLELLKKDGLINILHNGGGIKYILVKDHVNLWNSFRHHNGDL